MTNRGTTSTPSIAVGISACLLGERVRFDGGHKHDAFLTDTLGRHVQWIPVCPEVEAGLDVPRESMRLVREGKSVRLLTVRTGVDHTERMRRFAAARVAALAKHDLCGFVLKKNSPSCGLERVKIYSPAGHPLATGRGLFAEELSKTYPNLPIEEEGRLRAPQLRENFIERIFAYRRLRSLFGPRWTIGDLVMFHTVHKMQLAAHSPSLYAELGRLVAGAKTVERSALRTRYETDFMAALAVRATPKRVVNVLHHLLGYFSDRLDGAAKQELLGLIDDYRGGLVPLVVPLTLARHYIRVFDIRYLLAQTFLDPHPKELMLRNHV